MSHVLTQTTEIIPYTLRFASAPAHTAPVSLEERVLAFLAELTTLPDFAINTEYFQLLKERFSTYSFGSDPALCKKAFNELCYALYKYILPANLVQFQAKFKELLKELIPPTENVEEQIESFKALFNLSEAVSQRTTEIVNNINSSIHNRSSRANQRTQQHYERVKQLLANASAARELMDQKMNTSVNRVSDQMQQVREGFNTIALTWENQTEKLVTVNRSVQQMLKEGKGVMESL